MTTKRFVNLIIYALIFLLALLAGLVLFTQLVYAQETDCILVFDDNDDPGYYDEFSFTDDQGRDICKVRIVFHDPAPGDPNGAVFTESGSQNGYTADFNGASVHVWRSGSPYSISHSKVWVHQPAPTDTPVPPTTEIPPTDIPPTDTPTATLPPGVTPSPTPPTLPPPPDTYTPTPGTGTSIPPYPPPATDTPPAYPPPDTQVPPHDKPPELPQTGFGEMTGDNFGLWFGIAIICSLLIVAARTGRRAR